MQRVLLSIGLIFYSSLAFSQLSKKDLNGEWYTDDSIVKNPNLDTVTLYFNKVEVGSTESCSNEIWVINKRKMSIWEENNCQEVPTKLKLEDNLEISLDDTDFCQLLAIKYGGSERDFKVIEFHTDSSENMTTHIQLVQFDKIGENRLYNTVDSIISKVLKYVPGPVDSSNFEGIIRDQQNGNPPPLLVLNGYIVEDKELLKRFLLAETIVVSEFQGEGALSIYGQRAKNGVVLVRVSDRRFDDVVKKYLINE